LQTDAAEFRLKVREMEEALDDERSRASNAVATSQSELKGQLAKVITQLAETIHAVVPRVV
jgi:hypothetical protein